MKSPTPSADRYSLLPTSLSLSDENQQSLKLPIDGSLGLLALGYVGLMAWRGAKMQINKSANTDYSSALLLHKHEA